MDNSLFVLWIVYSGEMEKKGCAEGKISRLSGQESGPTSWSEITCTQQGWLGQQALKA